MQRTLYLCAMARKHAHRYLTSPIFYAERRENCIYGKFIEYRWNRIRIRAQFTAIESLGKILLEALRRVVDRRITLNKRPRRNLIAISRILSLRSFLRRFLRVQMEPNSVQREKKEPRSGVVILRNTPMRKTSLAVLQETRDRVLRRTSREIFSKLKQPRARTRAERSEQVRQEAKEPAGSFRNVFCRVSTRRRNVGLGHAIRIRPAAPEIFSDESEGGA